MLSTSTGINGVKIGPSHLLIENRDLSFLLFFFETVLGREQVSKNSSGTFISEESPQIKDVAVAVIAVVWTTYLPLLLPKKYVKTASRYLLIDLKCVVFLCEPCCIEQRKNCA